MKIAVCDDCQEDALHLKGLLKEHDVTVYNGAKHLLSDIEKRMHFDLYLLDIYIDVFMNGIELAKRLRTLNEEAVICFISTSDSFYREAYDLYAIQYLLKPVQEDAMKQLLERIARNSVRNKEQRICFKWHGETGMISYDKILFISSSEHTLSIHCKDGYVQECKGKLNEMELQIYGNVFCRSHQSFLVNMYQVDSLNGNELVVSGYHIPISRRYYMDVKRRYQEILFEEVD